MKSVEMSGMKFKPVERSNAGKNNPPSCRKYKFLESVIVSKGLRAPSTLADADSYVFRGAFETLTSSFCKSRTV